jgi:peptidoglycan hydrolase-like protein with peptidoglycan-binding domain
VLRDSRTLATPPVDISISRDGSAIAILMSGGSQLEILQPKSLPDSITPSSEEQSQLLKAQEALSQLGYPVGSVDGKPGPQTSDSISLFQSRTGRKVTGELDADTLNAILNAGQR